MVVIMFNENIAVSQLSELFALALGKSPERAKQIGIAGALHDVGKKLIDPHIINKADKLTDDEFEILKTHTKLGAELLSDLHGDLGKIVAKVCEFHHERVDGKGYWNVPLKDLPDYVAIVGISDVFVACCAERPYKEPWSPDQSLAHIKNIAGTHFPVELVDSFSHFMRKDKNALSILGY